VSSGNQPNLKARVTGPGFKMPGPHHSSLLWRFLLIGVVALSPLIGALVQFAGDERNTALDATRRRAELLVSFAIERHQHVIDEAKAFMDVLASSAELHAGEAECHAFLARNRSLHTWTKNLWYQRHDGKILCGEESAHVHSGALGSGYISEALAKKDFLLSNLALEEETGAFTLVGAVPVEKGGQVTGILFTSLIPRILEDQSAHTISSDLDISFLIFSRKGHLIAQHPPVEGSRSFSLQEQDLISRALEQPERSVGTLDSTGKRRLFVSRNLPGTEAVLAVGLDRDAVLGAVDQALYFRLILITLMITGSLLLGVLGAEVLIFRPLRSLVRTADALAKGDFRARSPYEGPSEIGILARALNQMAEAVADREHQLKHAKEIAEQALSDAQRANNAKTDFLASMSHEIRTPLNGIIGYTERLLDEDLTLQQRYYTGLIQVAGSALLTVANDVLDFSSIEAEQIKLHIEPFRLSTLIDNTVSIVSSGAGQKSVPIGISVPFGMPDLLLGDEARLRQILLNLLNNAVKFTRKGSITVQVNHKSTTARGELVRISVIDTGIGIPRDKQDLLFRRFSQVDRSIRREFGGTGLGLAISKRLIELMGGEIGVESEEGQGSTFWIEATFPRAATLAEEQVQANIPIAENPGRILLAEDIELNQDLARSILEAAGHSVDVVSNGEEAVAAVKEKVYDIVLMDIQMPGTDGITATRKIRALNHPASNVVIIAMTANVLPQQVRVFIDAGMNGHIGKPVRRDDLFRKLSEWLPSKSDSAASPAPAVEALFDRGDYEDFERMVGTGTTAKWLNRLDDQLDNIFASGGCDRIELQTLAAQSHAIVSQAALLGFADLAERCRELEQACAGKENLSATYVKAKEAARITRQIIAGLNERTGSSV
jgi:signal transduction histidine kinase/ActR/RegA family two-component response regulator